MKKIFLLISFCFMISIATNAQQSLNEMSNQARYAEANADLGLPKKGEKRVVFIGNSITDAWPYVRPDFFKKNNYVGRGIGGQTSPQLLLRFQQDVIDLKPELVVINIGTNDIALNTGNYNSEFTLSCIKSMAEIAQANGIKVILSAVLPVGEYPWRKDVKNVPQKIDALNIEIKAYADKKGFVYVDYNTPMRENNGAMIATYGDDGVHTNASGYEVMEKTIKPVIDKIIK